MPIDNAKALQVWTRYAYARDNGHSQFIEKADKCERFFAGDQWDAEDKARLKLQRRPALTINKIISTLTNIMGEQIYNRSEIAFRPRNGAPASLAEVMTKVFKYISDNNQLDWKRSDMFADGAITSRGFIDARIVFDDHMRGDVKYTVLNPKNVVIDPDGEEYDPDTWNEVMVSKWLTADDIAILYSKEDAELLRNRSGASVPFGYDSIDDNYRSRFGTNSAAYYSGSYDESNVRRNIRVIERQFRTLDKQKHFVSMEGDTRPIPSTFDRDRIAWFVQQFGFNVIDKLVHRIKWIVVADNVVLHEDWSPYKHLTVVPYFPLFRHGTTIGLVENLLGPQELLNKTSSQELHVMNTTANSGWKVKAGALVNMSIEELEQRGAETGLVAEVAGDPDKDLIKIQPNQIPTGLERMSFKAEESIKTISGRSDSAQGFDREDVAAKAIQAKRQANSTNLAKPLDSLSRSDYILARNTVDMIQTFYTEERVLTITKDRVTGETEEFTINQATPEGTIINDLTLGEYAIVVSSVPQRETLEDSQFEQALGLREIGIMLPDEVLIENSRLMNKGQIIKRMNESKQTPEAQRAAAAALAQQEAEARKTALEAENKGADTQLKLAKAAKEMKEVNAPPEQADQSGMVKAVADIELDREKFEHEKQMDYARLMEERRQNRVEEALEAEDMAEKRADERAQRALEMSQGAAMMTSTPEGE